mmetsp:Transcript_25148/g.68358  ORF Transcript_25148/g.68358 Transcript_25148/m.68358 type:complete len:134 (+) Transcript_25148:903-1304(+)
MPAALAQPLCSFPHGLWLTPPLNSQAETLPFFAPVLPQRQAPTKLACGPARREEGVGQLTLLALQLHKMLVPVLVLFLLLVLQVELDARVVREEKFGMQRQQGWRGALALRLPLLLLQKELLEVVQWRHGLCW